MTSWEAGPLGIVQEIKIWPYEQMVYAEPSSRPGKWESQTPMEFWHTNGSPNLGQTTRPYYNQQPQKKWNWLNCELCCPMELWNMKVTIIPFVIGAFGKVTKGLIQGLEDLEISGRVEIISTTTLLRSARILRRALETLGDLLSLTVQWMC